MKSRSTSIDLGLTILGLLLVWQAAAWLVNKPILPGPITVGTTLIQEIQGDLPEHFLVSLWRVTASMLLSIITAVPAGLVLGQSQRLNALFSPLIYILYPNPKS